MFNETGQELRRIRITLVVMAILLLFTGGRQTVTVDHTNSNGNSDPYLINSNMVPLGEGYFGVLTSDTHDTVQTMKVYFYDKEKNEVVFKYEKSLLAEQP
jgi:hypothetical protein